MREKESDEKKEKAVPSPDAIACSHRVDLSRRERKALDNDHAMNH